jgi:hypothetical protein
MATHKSTGYSKIIVSFLFKYTCSEKNTETKLCPKQPKEEYLYHN